MGQTYILVLHEALWIGDKLYNTLFNPNQLRHYETQVQDKLMSESLLYIITTDREFSKKLSMEGTIVFANAHTSSDKQIRECPHINIGLQHPWYPMKVFFQNALNHWRRK